MKKIFYILILSISILLFSNLVLAEDISKAVFPIAELGNCKDQDACKVFCDAKENMLACVNYGQKNGMISEAEASVAKRAIPKIIAGQTPGNCKDRLTCEAFCQSTNEHLQECVDFAEEIGALAPEELAQAKKVAKVFAEGIKTPGNCVGKSKCEAYCSKTENLEECLSFAEKSDILPKAEIDEARKVMTFLQAGQTPGKCKTKKEYKDYCDKDANFDECILFAQTAGFVTKEEADMAKKVGGKGPGGCKGKEECATYCDDSSHAEECANFAIEKNLVSQEEKDLIKTGVSKIRSGLGQIPENAKPELEKCLNNLIGDENFAKFKAGQDFFLTKKQGDGIANCFTSVMSNYSGGSGNGGGTPSQGGSSIPSVPPANYEPTASDCAKFSGVPSCSYVPESVRAICEKCK